MDKTLGAYSILACQKAMDDAGVTPDQIDGIICCQSHIAGVAVPRHNGRRGPTLTRPTTPSGDSHW